MTISISAVNDRPVAQGQSVSTAAGTAKAITLAGSDVEGSALSFAIASPPPAAQGSVTLSGSTATFTPATGFSGSASFTFTVGDGALTSVPATVTVLVAAPPPALLTVQVRLTGTVDAGTVSLTVNGVAAAIDGTGTWSATVPVPVGATAVELRATDAAGNATVRTLQLARAAGG